MGTAGLSAVTSNFNSLTSPLKITKWINPKGEEKLTASMEKNKIFKAGELLGEETADQVAEVELKEVGEAAPCTNSIPGPQAQLISLGCSLLEGTSLDMLQHGVSGQLIGTSPNLDFHNKDKLS